MFLTDRLSTIGNKGLFTKEIDQAQISKKVDISIHSLKDLPTKLEKGLVIGALLKREDSRDALISRDNLTIFKLRKNAIIGTSSLRREMLVKKIRPDLKVRIIRGIVPILFCKSFESLSGRVSKISIISFLLFFLNLRQFVYSHILPDLSSE